MKRKTEISNLHDHLGFWLRFVSNHVSHAFAQKIEATGVTVAEWVILRELFNHDGIAPSDLATLTGLTRGAISKLVQRLLTKNLLTRKHLDDDLRFQTLALTSEGRSLVPKLAAL